MDQANTEDLRNRADELRPLGIEVTLGASAPPARDFSLAVLSSALPMNVPLVEAVRRTGVPLISELELGLQLSECLCIAIGGTNGKGTTAELVERVLASNHRKTALSGDLARPVCATIEHTKELDYLILQTDAFQLEMTSLPRPSIAVLTNLTPDHLDHYGSRDNYVRANARLFRNQIAEIHGVQFINDSKATNLDALGSALRAARSGPGGEANVWLIAGGRDKGQELHPVGTLLTNRVKHAFLVGETSKRLYAAWSVFTPCTISSSLLEAVAEAARNAVSGDVVLLSPACSNCDQFRNHQHRGEVFCQAVKSIGRGVPGGTPNINGRIGTAQR
ncbi:MAG TPA: Mur ligase family protein [Candidatus Paceibacterota bacterium]|nr:Mur ligase family protein [Verrucomicrobiota bacterium]HSA11507.1 Mur ligase family protein [Candidatus Paceibacterota bacterium]